MVNFKDITTIMDNGEAYKYATDQIVSYAKNKQVDVVVGPEARGFIIGCPVSYAMGIGFAPVRKEGKLPREVIAESYELEYGKDTLEIHKDAISEGDRVLLVDDLLATGGTIEATTNLVRRLGGTVEDAAFVINLPDIGGEARLQGLGLNVFSICDFPGH